MSIAAKPARRFQPWMLVAGFGGLFALVLGVAFLVALALQPFIPIVEYYKEGDKLVVEKHWRFSSKRTREEGYSDSPIRYVGEITRDGKKHGEWVWTNGKTAEAHWYFDGELVTPDEFRLMQKASH